jgi:hypothetical protein
MFIIIANIVFNLFLLAVLRGKYEGKRYQLLLANSNSVVKDIANLKQQDILLTGIFYCLKRMSI